MSSGGRDAIINAFRVDFHPFELSIALGSDHHVGNTVVYLKKGQTLAHDSVTICSVGDIFFVAENPSWLEVYSIY